MNAANPLMIPAAHHSSYALSSSRRKDGKFDAIKYIKRRREAARRRRRKRLHAVSLVNLVGCGTSDSLAGSDDDDSAASPEPKLRCATNKHSRLDSSGVFQRIYPHTSTWYFLYVGNELIHHDDDLQSQFRNRFRMTYNSYSELVGMCKGFDIFSAWRRKKKNTRGSIIELVLLGSLRYLGRGWTFDDIEESTAISADTHRRFLHCFLDYGSTVLFNKFVKFPINFEEAKTHMAEFAVAGFPGCIGSADCTHIVTDRCQYNLKNHHLGAKSSLTTRSFSLTANHRRRILHTCPGGPGRWNDQTMVMYDSFIKGLHEGLHLSDIAFTLQELDRDGNVMETDYCGGYIIVDNGFLSWAVTVPPHKQTNNIPAIRWSQWLESMRKDIECTFGILKGRWRILKTGVRLHGIQVVDKVWMTCCALHNWLLDEDGNGDEWTGGCAIEDWLGKLGENDLDHDEDNPPAVFDRLLNNLNIRNYDLSGMGPGPDAIGTEMEMEDDNDNDDGGEFQATLREGDIVEVRKLPLTFFRSKLIQHFDILYRSGKLIWPRKE